MSRPELFVPNEMETHLIVFHQVTTRQLIHYRQHCKDHGHDYDLFLVANHNFITTTRPGECDGKEA